MRIKQLARLFQTSLVTALLALLISGAAQAQCRPGDTLIGETATAYICSHPGDWKRGEWTPDFATANILGGCVQTWKCTLPRGTTIMRSSDSHLVTTGKQNTRGACTVTDNPKSCGHCVAGEPAAICQYCVESAECSNASLGWRTRQALGCCH
jgi:hypothetical protein